MCTAFPESHPPKRIFYASTFEAPPGKPSCICSLQRVIVTVAAGEAWCLLCFWFWQAANNGFPLIRLGWLVSAFIPPGQMGSDIFPPGSCGSHQIVFQTLQGRSQLHSKIAC